MKLNSILILFFMLIAAMIAIRFYCSGGHGFVFLVWNLFLAWIPYAMSTYFKRMIAAPAWQQGLILLVWFLFYPNAFYMVTDLIHLDLDTNIPKWFDAVLLFTSSIVALMMGFTSLLRLEYYLTFKMKPIFVQVVMTSVIFLGSFGVYLGRFLRWNSWDVVENPLQLIGSIAIRVNHPLSYWQTWGITLLLTALFYLMFVAVKAIKTAD